MGAKHHAQGLHTQYPMLQGPASLLNLLHLIIFAIRNMPPMTNRVILRAIQKLPIITVCIGLMTCAPDEICFTDNSTLVRIDFKRVVYADTDSAFLENDTLIFFQVSALETDSIFIQLDTLSSLVLPVNTGQDQTTFTLDTDRGSHHLELQYHRAQRLISVECGPEQIFDQLEARAATFDSLSIKQPNLTDPPATNVEIYN